MSLQKQPLPQHQHQQQHQPQKQEKLIVSSFSSRQDFISLLEKNPGLVILKLGDTWCGPCKKIKPVVDAFYASSPDSVICCDVDVDESFDLYAYLKSKKMEATFKLKMLRCLMKTKMNCFPLLIQ